ncbi:MAG: hypothetical protein U1F21_16695 [Sphaerotilus natans]
MCTIASALRSVTASVIDLADGLAQHAHAAVVQQPAGADDVDGARHAARIERPQLGAAAVMQQEVLLQLAQPLRDGRRHLLRHVALAQLLEAVAAPQAQRGLVGPEHAALVDVVEPDRRAQPLQRRDMGCRRGLSLDCHSRHSRLDGVRPVR